MSQTLCKLLNCYSNVHYHLFLTSSWALKRTVKGEPGTQFCSSALKESEKARGEDTNTSRRFP